MSAENDKFDWTLESDWLDPREWMRRAIVDKLSGVDQPLVTYRGQVYPSRFSATWLRSDGLRVDLDIRADAARGLIPLSVTISRSDGVEGNDYRLPIASMTRQAADEIWRALSESGRMGLKSGEKVTEPVGIMFGDADTLRDEADRLQSVSMRAPTKRTDQARLKRVAELYQQALEEGLGVTTLIEREEHVARSTAYGLIKRARKTGLLAPAKPGRKGNGK